MPLSINSSSCSRSLSDKIVQNPFFLYLNNGHFCERLYLSTSMINLKHSLQETA